jgi:hypothetical protein
MIVQGFAKLQLVVSVGMNSRGTSRCALQHIVHAHPVRLMLHFHFLLELMSVEESQVDAAFVV